MRKTRSILTVIIVCCFLLNTANAQVEHFHPKGKPPSKHTIKKFEEARKTLPFADKRDFEEEKKGFIAAPDLAEESGGQGSARGRVRADRLVVFDPRFEIMPGSKGPSPGEDLYPYEVGPVELRGE